MLLLALDSASICRQAALPCAMHRLRKGSAQSMANSNRMTLVDTEITLVTCLTDIFDIWSYFFTLHLFFRLIGGFSKLARSLLIFYWGFSWWTFYWFLDKQSTCAKPVKNSLKAGRLLKREYLCCNYLSKRDNILASMLYIFGLLSYSNCQSFILLFVDDAALKKAILLLALTRKPRFVEK